MDTCRIRALCHQIEKARSMMQIEVAERPKGGDPKAKQIPIINVDVSLGSGYGGATIEEANTTAAMLARVWIEPLQEVERRAVEELRKIVTAGKAVA